MITIPKGLQGKELFKWLVNNKAMLMDAKKSAIKFADPIQLAPTWAKDEVPVTKGKYLFEDNVDTGVLKRTIVANTYLWMDSHSDVHLENTFTNSIAQKASRPAPLLLDHNFSMLAKIGRPIAYSEREISWRELGQGKTGKTIALMLEADILKSYNDRIFNEYLDGQVDQHSVSMRYIKLALAVNDGETYPNEYKVWADNIAKLGNRPAAEAQGYFWAVSEAALNETSAVLAGSNELTPTLGSNKTEPLEDIQPVKPRKALDMNKVLQGYLN
jgi:hypothetical protein